VPSKKPRGRESARTSSRAPHVKTVAAATAAANEGTRRRHIPSPPARRPQIRGRPRVLDNSVDLPAPWKEPTDRSTTAPSPTQPVAPCGRRHLPMGPGGHRLSRHRVPFQSKRRAFKVRRMTWRAVSARPCCQLCVLLHHRVQRGLPSNTTQGESAPTLVAARPATAATAIVKTRAAATYWHSSPLALMTTAALGDPPPSHGPLLGSLPAHLLQQEVLRRLGPRALASLAGAGRGCAAAVAATALMQWAARSKRAGPPHETSVGYLLAPLC
jgi:hypothetical protein